MACDLALEALARDQLDFLAPLESVVPSGHLASVVYHSSYMLPFCFHFDFNHLAEGTEHIARCSLVITRCLLSKQHQRPGCH